MLEPDSTYITPFTTIGVTSGVEGLGGFERFDGVRGSTRFRFHAGCSLPTLSALICFRGENFLPARSRAYIGQSPSAGFWARMPTTSPARASAANIRRN